MDNGSIHVSVVPHLKKYNWPSEGDDVWRHLTDYILYDEQERNIDLIFPDDMRGSAEIKGMLVPPPSSTRSGSSVAAIRVHFAVENYAIDFGANMDDPSRGLWLLGEDDVWYKLDGEAHSSYVKKAAKSLRLCDEYIRFYDAAVNGRGSGKKFADLNEKTMKYTCRLSVDALHKSSMSAFDLDILAANAKFYLDRAGTSFAKDCTLMKSLRSYANKQSDKTLEDDNGSLDEPVARKKLKYDNSAEEKQIVSSSSNKANKQAAAPASDVPTGQLKKLGRPAPKKIPLPPDLSGSSIMQHELLSGLVTTTNNATKAESPNLSTITTSPAANDLSCSSDSNVISLHRNVSSATSNSNVRVPRADWLAVAKDIQIKRNTARTSAAANSSPTSTAPPSIELPSASTTASRATASPSMTRDEMLAYITKLNAAKAKQAAANSPATDPRLARLQNQINK